MRTLVITALCLAAAGPALAGDYRETRDLAVDAGGLTALVIDAGAGTLEVRGVAGLDSIVVRATIVVADAGDDEGRDLVSKRARLALDLDGDVARLESHFDQGLWGLGSNGRIDLDVQAPSDLPLRIIDGAGSMDVENFVSNVTIEDASGSLEVHGTGRLEIVDGSGSIEVSRAAGDVDIDDGSGSITVETVDGSVKIDDGSGSIRVSDVSGDLVIVDAGSGSVNYTDIRGEVREDE